MEASGRPGESARRIILLTALGLIALGLGLGGGSLAYTAQPSFCNSCHPMTTRYVTWQRSTHAQAASCLDCHSEPGAVGDIQAHLNGARYLFVMLTGESSGSVIQGKISNESCLECHPAERLRGQVGKHRVDHTTHLKRAISCAACHGNLVHGSLRGAALRPSMATCVDCHSGKTPVVLTACATCHGPSPARVSSSQLSRPPLGGQ